MQTSGRCTVFTIIFNKYKFALLQLQTVLLWLSPYIIVYKKIRVVGICPILKSPADNEGNRIKNKTEANIFCIRYVLFIHLLLTAVTWKPFIFHTVRTWYSFLLALRRQSFSIITSCSVPRFFFIYHSLLLLLLSCPKWTLLSTYKPYKGKFTPCNLYYLKPMLAVWFFHAACDLHLVQFLQLRDLQVLNLLYFTFATYIHIENASGVDR